jgi:hypothetical protein
VMLRDMRSGEQKTIPLSEIARFLKQLKVWYNIFLIYYAIALEWKSKLFVS